MGPLTEDHVPPRGWVRPREVELHTLGDFIGQAGVPPVFMQAGVKFLTLCAHCNNDLLGSFYDPELISLARDVATIARTARRLHLPRPLTVRAKVQRVAKAIVGHLLAADVRDDMSSAPVSTPAIDSLRRYFLAPSEPLPTDVSIHYWMYSGDIQAVFRGMGIGSGAHGGHVVFDTLKCFPLGFAVSYASAGGARLAPATLLSDRNLGPDDVAELVLDVDTPPPADWPEQPRDYEYVLFRNSRAYLARDRLSRRPKSVAQLPVAADDAGASRRPRR
jgi:hypothetical protein